MVESHEWHGSWRRQVVLESWVDVVEVVLCKGVSGSWNTWDLIRVDLALGRSLNLGWRWTKVGISGTKLAGWSIVERVEWCILADELRGKWGDRASSHAILLCSS